MRKAGDAHRSHPFSLTNNAMGNQDKSKSPRMDECLTNRKHVKKYRKAVR